MSRAQPGIVPECPPPPEILCCPPLPMPHKRTHRGLLTPSLGLCLRASFPQLLPICAQVIIGPSHWTVTLGRPILTQSRQPLGSREGSGWDAPYSFKDESATPNTSLALKL